MGNDNIFMVLIGAVLAYLFISKSSDETDQPVSTATSGACPRGTRYTRGFFGDCDPNYVASGWFDQYCDCLSKNTVSTPTLENDLIEAVKRAEQTIHTCPYDRTLLAGDRRCTRERMEEIKTLTDYGFSVDGLTGSYDPATGKFVYIGN